MLTSWCWAPAPFCWPAGWPFPPVRSQGRKDAGGACWGMAVGEWWQGWECGATRWCCPMWQRRGGCCWGGAGGGGGFLLGGGGLGWEERTPQPPPPPNTPYPLLLLKKKKITD